MKPIKIGLTALMLCSVIALSAGCQQKQIEEVPEEITAVIQRGDLILDISAVGNLAFSEKQILNFEQAGTVTEVLVQTGDYVVLNQILARLDTSERDDYLKSLSREIDLKDQALLQAEINLQNAQKSLDDINSQSYVDRKTAQAELDVVNAKIALAAAETNYENAKDLYEQNWTVPERIRNYEQRTAQLDLAKLSLAEAEQKLASVIDDINLEREIKQKELVIVSSKLEDAQKAYDTAVNDLEQAQMRSWDIRAPFEGFITKVNIANGQNVQRSTGAFEIANPDEFEADVMVSEIDIANVSIGTSATMQMDAMQSVLLPAEVVRISPTAVVQSGVVNYMIKVRIKTGELDLSEFGMSRDSESMFRESSGITGADAISDMLAKAVEEGRMTQEQVDKIEEDARSGITGRTYTTPVPGDTPREGFVSPPVTDSKEEVITVIPDSSTQSSTGEFSMETTSADIQLREGLTVTVSIFVDSRNDVLVVPSGAIRTSAGQQFVTILHADGTREERAIVTGLSDWQNTEVMSGLTEGEQVVYTPVSSSQSGIPGGVYMAPGGVVVRETVR